MKRVYAFAFLLLGCFMIVSCKSNYEQNQAGFEKLNKDLTDKFGKDTWYTSISLSKGGTDNEGYLVAVDKTDDPSSLRQERWVKAGGMWEQAANVTLEVKGGKPSDFMFRLDKEIRLAELGRLVEVAKKKLAEEKKIATPDLKLAIVSTNNTVLSKEEKINYTIMLTDGGNTYSFTYDLKGNLRNSNY